MEPELAEFDREWRTGDRERARELACAYVAAHRAALAPYLGGLSIDELVALVTAYRGMGREDDRIVVDMWLLSEHPPQQISGSIRMGAEAVIEAAEAIIRGKEY